MLITIKIRGWLGKVGSRGWRDFEGVHKRGEVPARREATTDGVHSAEARQKNGLYVQ